MVYIKKSFILIYYRSQDYTSLNDARGEQDMYNVLYYLIKPKYYS